MCKWFSEKSFYVCILKHMIFPRTIRGNASPSFYDVYYVREVFIEKSFDRKFTECNRSRLRKEIMPL